MFTVQPGLGQWGNLGPNSIQGNHARMLHGNGPPPPNSNTPGNLQPGAMPLRPPGSLPPLQFGLNTQPGPPFPQSLPPLSAGGGFTLPQPSPQHNPSSSQHKGPSEEFLRPPLMDNPPMGGMEPGSSSQQPGQSTLGNSVLNAAWLSSFQRNGLPPGNPLNQHTPPSTQPQSLLPQTPAPPQVVTFHNQVLSYG